MLSSYEYVAYSSVSKIIVICIKPDGITIYPKYSNIMVRLRNKTCLIVHCIISQDFKRSFISLILDKINSISSILLQKIIR